MKKQLLYLFTGFLLSLSVSGCGNDITTAETGGELVPITFSAGATSVEVRITPNALTKADNTIPTFPNNGSIALLAANASSTAINAGGWAESNLYIKYAAATADAWDKTSFPIRINEGTIYHWPINPDQYLTFTAYSPAKHATMKNKTEDASLGDTQLQIEVNTTNKVFPDLLYSTPTNVMNKTTANVSLTQFEHAMARLVIKVIGVDKNGKEIENYSNAANLNITQLNVLTNVTKGVFNFVTPGWTLNVPDVPATYHTLHSFAVSAEDKGKLPYDSSKEQEVYILPSTLEVNTVELSKIEFKIKDAVLEYGKSDGYLINEFTDKTNSSTPVTLEMGKTTVLTFKIRVTEVSTGDTESIVLEGNLAPWDYKGNSSVTIE